LQYTIPQKIFEKEEKRKKMNCLVNEWVKGNGFSLKNRGKKETNELPGE